MSKNLLNRREMLAASTGFITFTALAQTPLRILCGAPPGSVPDTIARRYAEWLGSRRSGGAIVENRPGAAGQLAIQALRQAPADGQTLLLAPSAISTAYPSLYSKLAYDADSDLRSVSAAAEANMALAVGPVVPATVRSLSALVEWAKAHPSQANFGSPGMGTLPHIVSAMFFQEAKVPAVHVAYPGGPPAIVDLLGGRIAALTLPEGLLRQHHASGTLRLLATSGAVRGAFLPEVPTFAEQGYRGLVVREWFAFYLSGAASESAAATAAAAIAEAASSPELVTAFQVAGMTAVFSTPQATVQRIATERRYWREAIAATGIRAD